MWMGIYLDVDYADDTFGEVSEEEEARMNLLFIEYLKQFVQGRVDGVKKNIVNSLGEEAYYRICRYGELCLED